MKNLIFDLGGVMYTLDYTTLWSTLGEKSGRTLPDVQKAIADAGMSLFERGGISPARYFDNLRGILRCDVSFSEFRALWNGILERRDEMFRLASFLKTRLALFALSNTNRLHAELLDRDLKPIITAVVYSFREGHLKPDRRIYTRAFRRWRIRPEDSLYVDDAPLNCETARGLGCAVHTFVDVPGFLHVLSASGVLPPERRGDGTASG